MTDQTGKSTTRRALFAGAGAVGVAGVLTACGTEEPSGSSGDNPGAATTTPPAPEEPFSANKSDIPVGGGAIYGEYGVVVTQPTAGDFRGFSAICTHQQCVLANVSNGSINCRCHDSMFDIADGSPKGGPATAALSKRDLKTDGDAITLA